MEKIRILFLHSSDSYGGILRNLSLIIANLDKNKFDIKFLLSQNGDKKPFLLEDGVREYTEIFLEKSKIDISLIKKVKTIIQDKDIDILSCHGYKANFIGFVLKYFYFQNIKILTIAHGWVASTFKLKIYEALDKILILFFNKVIFINNEQRNKLIFKPKRSSLIHNAIDYEKFINQKFTKLSRKSLGLKEDDFILGFCGRLSEEKSIITSLKALKILKKKFENIKFLIAGEGHLSIELESYVEKHNLSDQVIFLDFIEDIRAFYDLLDVYLSSSLTEGLPNSVLEAQSLGVPCICSEIAGHSDIITHGSNGYLFEVNNYKELASNIEYLFINKSFVDNMKTNSINIIKNKFGIEKRINLLQKEYLGLCVK